ncbi:hypothetical protein RDI58_016157 [Solanum bulbocastanum]|uniref:Uncharacterized protein n=1 Tax=Solanum bulbocastanum TaxID=147425 RepID=A0AAN8YCM8_SOLBU
MKYPCTTITLMEFENCNFRNIR